MRLVSHWDQLRSPNAPGFGALPGVPAVPRIGDTKRPTFAPHRPRKPDRMAVGHVHGTQNGSGCPASVLHAGDGCGLRPSIREPKGGSDRVVRGLAVNFDQQASPARDVCAEHADRACRGAASAQHPGSEPGFDLGRQVPDWIAAAEVDPDPRGGIDRWAGDEQEFIALTDGGDVLGTITENDAMNR